MAIKEIRKLLKDAKIDATVKYTGQGDCEYSTHYQISFPKIEGNKDWDNPADIMDDYDAESIIGYYLSDLEESLSV